MLLGAFQPSKPVGRLHCGLWQQAPALLSGYEDIRKDLLDRYEARGFRSLKHKLNKETGKKEPTVWGMIHLDKKIIFEDKLAPAVEVAMNLDFGR